MESRLKSKPLMHLSNTSSGDQDRERCAAILRSISRVLLISSELSRLMIFNTSLKAAISLSQPIGCSKALPMARLKRAKCLVAHNLLLIPLPTVRHSALVAHGVVAHVAHVDAPRRVREHLQHVIFRPRVVVFGREDAALGPDLLPAGLGLAGVVALVFARIRGALAGLFTDPRGDREEGEGSTGWADVQLGLCPAGHWRRLLQALARMSAIASDFTTTALRPRSLAS